MTSFCNFPATSTDLITSSNQTILCKIFWEKISNQANLDNTEKLWYLLWCTFWGPVPEVYFSGGDWVAMQVWDFGYIYYFLISLDSKSGVVQRLVRHLVHEVSDARHQVPFHLWWMEHILKIFKIPVNYAKDCRKIFLLLLTFLKMVKRSEHTATLIQVRITYRKRLSFRQPIKKVATNES